MGSPDSLQQLIANATGEREIQRALESSPWTIKEAVEGCCNCCWIVPEFHLGDEYKADFVVLHGFSGGWDLHFIELEPAHLPPFTGAGVFGERLNKAAKQIRDWKRFFDDPSRKPYLIARLRDAAIRKDLLWKDEREPFDHAGRPMTDPDAQFIDRYYVVMGQRRHLHGKALATKAALERTDGFELMTYDRLVEIHQRQTADPPTGAR